MKIEDAYLQFVNQVNRNLTNNNINVDKPRFILLFNDISLRYLEWVLEKRNEDAIRYVSPLLTLEKKLSKLGSEVTHDKFKLPDDYFDLANLRVNAKSGSCGDANLKTWEAKSEDVEEIYNDVHNEPSLPWRETFYLTTNGKVAIYKKDFDIKEAFLSYYRYPVKVDIAGYIHIDGSASQNVDPELDDKVIGRILVAMSKEFAAINGDANSYKMDSDRLFAPI